MNKLFYKTVLLLLLRSNYNTLNTLLFFSNFAFANENIPYYSSSFLLWLLPKCRSFNGNRTTS